MRRQGFGKYANWAASIATVVIGVIATLMVFAQDRIFDADSFSITVASSLEDPAINDYLSEAISDALIEQVPDLGIGGPLLADVTGAVLESGVAVRAVELAASESHEAIFTDGSNSFVLELSDLVVSIDQALAAVSPDLADAIPEDVRTLSVDLSSGELSAGTVQFAEDMRAMTVVLVVLTIGLLVTLVVIEPTFFRGIARLGVALGSIGLVLVVMRAVGASVLASYGGDPLERDALSATWNIVLGDVATWGWSLILVGALVAGSGWAVLNTGRVQTKTRQLLADLTSRPTSKLGQLAHTTFALLVASWALLEPLTLLAAGIRIAGFILAVAIIATVIDELGIAGRLAAVQPEPDEVVPLRQVGVRALVPIAIVGALGLFGVALLAKDDDASALADPDACNGHVELCDRKLDEVTMVGSHNSMSSTANDFILPNHLSTIRSQLDHGVRGLMIDTWYGREAPDGSIRTSTDIVDSSTLDASALAAAEAVRKRQTSGLADEEVYLCHSVCEIGALDAVDELRAVREWLDDNPREVLVFVVQDATDPADTAAAFDEAGFADLVLTHQLGEPFPTLGDMIDSGRRVFVMVEENGDGVDWLHQAFEFSQETPFSFSSADEFTCLPNRGESDSPLFVINHFITLARPSNQSINDYDQLLERAEACRDERGLVPNLLALDYATKGDAIAVADALNGVD